MTKLFVNFLQKVQPNQIRTETLDNIDYMVIKSRTMPDDIVMNKMLYSTNQIDATIHTINETPAPIGHPIIDGKHVLAAGQRAQNAFNQSGGFNKYIGKEGNSHLVEKWFPKDRLATNEQGKALLDAIAKGEPIHSSTGVIHRKLPSIGENKYGKYEHEAIIVNFDHDAVLLGEPGAATPEQGVGLMVNSDNEDMEVLYINMADIKASDTIKENINIEVTYNSTDKGLFANALQAFKDKFKTPTKTKPEQDDLIMNKLAIALNAVGVNTEGLDDGQLFEAYNKHMLSVNAKNEVKALTAEDVASLIANALTKHDDNKALAGKAALVESVIATNAKYTDADKEVLLATPELILNGLLPEKRAANLVDSLQNNDAGDSLLAIAMPQAKGA